MDKYVSRGHLTSGAPLDRTLEVSISSMVRAVRIRDLPLPYSTARSLYLTLTSGTLDTLVFPVYWDLSQSTAVISFTLDRDENPPTIVTISVVNPSSSEIVKAINEHSMLKAINEQGYLRVTALHADVHRIRVNERPDTAGQAQMSDIRNGIFRHVYVDRLGSTPDPRSYGIRGSVKSSPSRVETPTTNLSSYIQRHEDRTSSGINRAVDSVAANIEYIKDKLGSTRLKHTRLPVPLVYSSQFGESPVRWHKEGDSVTAVVIDGSLLEVLLPNPALEAKAIYALTDIEGRSFVRGNKNVDLLDIYGSPNDVFGHSTEVAEVKIFDNFIVEGDPISSSVGNSGIRVATDEWYLVDETTLDVQGAVIGEVTRGDLVEIDSWPVPYTFEVVGIPRDGRVNIKSACGSLLAPILNGSYSNQTIPPNLTGTLTIRRGVQSSVTEWVYIQLTHPIRIADLEDTQTFLSLPLLSATYDFSSADKPTDRLITLEPDTSEFLLRIQGPLYRDLSAHMEINLQSLHSRQGLGRSIFNWSRGLLTDPNFIDEVPTLEDSNRILGSVDTANYGAPITLKKNGAARNRPISEMSVDSLPYFDGFSSRREGLSLDNCTFNQEHNLLTLLSEDKGSLSLNDQGRIISVSARLGGVLELSSARSFVIVEIINRSRARLRPVIGSSSITTLIYPDIGQEIPCTCRFIPPVIADELTEYAALLSVSPSLKVLTLPFGGHLLSIPTHRAGCGGKDSISIRGGLIDKGGELHLETLSIPNINVNNVTLAAKVAGNSVVFLLGGTEILSQSLQGMGDLNNALYESLISPIVALGQQEADGVAGRSPATLLNGAVLRALGNTNIGQGSPIVEELKNIGAADLAVKSLSDSTYHPKDRKIHLTFEAGSHVKIGASPYPINNSERIVNLFTGMYEVTAVNVTDVGALEIVTAPRLRVMSEASFIQENIGRLSGALSNSTGYYVLGSASFYTAVEESKELRVNYPVRTITAGPNKSGLAVDAIKGSRQGIEITVGEGAKGVGVNAYSLGTGIEVRGSSAATYATSGKMIASNQAEATRSSFTNPAIDVERLSFSPFVFTNFVSTALSLGGEYTAQIAELTKPSGSFVYPNNILGAEEASDFIFRGTSPGIRAVSLLPSNSELLELGSSALTNVFVQNEAYTYREPSLMVGVKAEDTRDPSMYGALSVFSHLREESDKRSSARWSVANAAAQIRGDLYVHLGDLVIIPNVFNEAFRADLKYYDYNVPHIGYLGADRVSGVRTHLVPVGDAGILPLLNTESTPNKMYSNNQEFGQRKVVEVDHSLLALNIDSLPLENDPRRLNLESSYTQSYGKFSGKRRPYGRGVFDLVSSGEGLTQKAELLQTSSTRILGEPRKVSRWSDQSTTPLAVRYEGSALSVFLPSSDSGRYTQLSDVGRACRVKVQILGASDILKERKLGANEDNYDSELDYLRALLTSSGQYLTDSSGAAGLVTAGEFTGVTVHFCGLIESVAQDSIAVYGPNLSELLDLPLGGDDNLWARVSLLSNLRVTAEIFGKRWDLNASAIAADHITLTDTGAVKRPWGSDIVIWEDATGNILDYLPTDEVVRLTPTESGSFFRNDVYFYGNVVSRGGTASFERISAGSLVGASSSIDLSAGFISDSNNVVVKEIYDAATRASAWSAMRYIWSALRQETGTSGINANQQNRQVLPQYAMDVDTILEGSKSIGLNIDDSFSANLIKSPAYVSDVSSTYPEVKVHRRDTGYHGSLYVDSKTVGVSTPAFRSGVSSLSSSILFDLSNESSEFHVCAYSNEDLTISEGIREISVHEFDVYNDDNSPSDRTTKEIHVKLSCGADLRDGTAYLHRVSFSSGVLVEGKLDDGKVTGKMGSVYRYKYLFFVNIVDKETRYVQDTYIIQANPVTHQINVPHIRSETAPKLYDTGLQTRGVPAQYSIEDSWDNAYQINNSANFDTALNVMPSNSQLKPNYLDLDYNVRSYAFVNDIIHQTSSIDANLPMFQDSIFGQKWSLIPSGSHQQSVTVTDALGNVTSETYSLNGAFVGFIGEYFVPYIAQEDKLYAQAGNKYANTVGSYAPALRDAFSSIAELTPTRYVIKLPKPSSEWLGREFKVSVPSYSTHTGANPFLGAWSESRKVGSLSDYFFYIYRGYWSEHEGGSSILDCMYNIERTKNMYVSHLVPVVSPTGLIGDSLSSTWPFNVYTAAQINLWHNHLAVGKYDKTDSWVDTVLGAEYDPAEGSVVLLGAQTSAGTSKDIFFRSFGEPTYTIPYLHDDVTRPPYPGYRDIDASPLTSGASKLSNKSESSDILVVCDTSYISHNNMVVTKDNDIVDCIKVEPSTHTRLSYTCVPLLSNMVDTTSSSSIYDKAEGVVYKWVKV